MIGTKSKFGPIEHHKVVVLLRFYNLGAEIFFYEVA